MENSHNNSDYDVIIIGAGIAGINMAYRLQERCPDLTYCIVEGRHEIGGTWSFFKYPGIRSDSDLYTYSFPWRPWKGKSIAPGSQILQYVKDAAAEQGIDAKIKLNHRVDAVHWSTVAKGWSLDITVQGNTRTTLRSCYLALASGYYDYEEPLKTEIPGLNSFNGTVIHPQFWPRDFDYANKSLVIIGSGATAITLLPSLAKKAGRVTMLQRSPTYIASMPSESLIQKITKAIFPSFLAYRIIRLQWIFFILFVVRFCRTFPRLSRLLLLLRTKAELPSGMPLAPNFTPKYHPFDQNLCVCPDSDFYQAIKTGKGSIKTGDIDQVTARSIKLKSGEELHPDIIITATGLKLRFDGGAKFTVDGKGYNLAEHYLWKGVMLEDLPNCICISGYFDASWTLGTDISAQMACRLFNEKRKNGINILVPRRSEEERQNMKDMPVTYLNSTYVKAGEAVLPKAGNGKQWGPRPSYWQELLTVRWGDIRTSMECS
ncbi:Flavin monooxygenase-like protein [Metarhizium guizhouense ARSEF 977]|uniref:Flavin monooxygenase-like protein n=1 Tax=Metarhizium guizhouense (strain ARSEF 977) TaxID=1276136 RepID=A0A0B4GH20_METGA|nr:Flavin monooxygenase-like protein [Metarhizium guizhouense ARSEF 977]